MNVFVFQTFPILVKLFMVFFTVLFLYDAEFVVIILVTMVFYSLANNYF